MADRGFTLIEILVVIAIIGLIFGIGLFLSFDVYHGFSHRSERDIIVSMLERARSYALANVEQAPWGFCVAAGHYEVFHGASYSAGAVEQSLATSSAATVLGAPGCATNPVIFAQLSGTTTAAGPITITQGSAPADTITINDQGTISW
jgi:prepilin-type N-terminal cleavage/methylation domain-containing protein